MVALVRAGRTPEELSREFEPALVGLETDPTFDRGRYGYTSRRGGGKGASGFVAMKNAKAWPGAT